jgi:hypothetical protein
MTKDDRIFCSICAWRGKCAKKFSISGKDLLHCVDFSRDVTIKGNRKPAGIKIEDASEAAVKKNKKTNSKKD